MPSQPSGARLFILNLKDCVNVQEFRKLVEQAIPPKSIKHFFTIKKEEIGIIDVDFHETANKIQELFHGQLLYGVTLEVKIMGHRAKIWVGRLCPAVSNEYLKRAFETFGNVQRACVVANSGGKSSKWGFVEFEDPSSAQKAVQTCDENCFMLTRSGPPVQVEFWNEVDTFYGIREQFCEREGDSQKETSIAPRLAEKGAFEFDFAKRWKALADEEQRLKDDLKNKIMVKREKLLREHRKALDEEETRRLRYNNPPAPQNVKVNPYYPTVHPPAQRGVNFPPGPAQQFHATQGIPPSNLAKGYSITSTPTPYPGPGMMAANKKHPWKKNAGHRGMAPPTNSHNSRHPPPMNSHNSRHPPPTNSHNSRHPPPPTNSYNSRHHPYRR